MFNRVKFVINRNLVQISKKKKFDKINKYNKYKFNSTSASTRKFSSCSKGQPPNPFNNIFFMAAILCGSFFIIKNKNKN